MKLFEKQVYVRPTPPVDPRPVPETPCGKLVVTDQEGIHEFPIVAAWCTRDHTSWYEQEQPGLWIEFKTREVEDYPHVVMFKMRGLPEVPTTITGLEDDEDRCILYAGEFFLLLRFESFSLVTRTNSIHIQGEFWTDDWMIYDGKMQDTRFQFEADFALCETSEGFWQP